LGGEGEVKGKSIKAIPFLSIVSKKKEIRAKTDPGSGPKGRGKQKWNKIPWRSK